MKFIGFGALVVDYYYKGNRFLGRMNGKSFANISINLKNLGNQVEIYGSVGNDETGKFALKTLEKLQIKAYIKEVKKKTNRIYIAKNKQTKEWEGVRYWYDENKNYSIKATREDIIIVDNVNKNTLENIKKTTCEKVLDLGYGTYFIYLNKEKIIELFKNKFSIINMNERAYNKIQNKLKRNAQEICKLFSVKLLIVTYGAKGMMFATPKFQKDYKIEHPYFEVDTSGAGDAFFAVILNEYVKNNRKIDEKFFDKCFIKGNKYIKNVVGSYGAIGHIIDLMQ